MLAHLKSPAPELADPIRMHFRMRKETILEQVRGWAEDKHNSARHASHMTALAAELEAVMNKHL